MFSSWLRGVDGSGPVFLDPTSDARPVDTLRRRLRHDPEAERRLRRRRRVAGGLVTVVLAVASLAAWLGEGGYRSMRRKERQLAEMSASLEAARSRVADLRETVRRLEEDPAARERIAREELGFVRHGEVDFLLPRSAAGAFDPSGTGTAPAPPPAPAN